MANQGVLLLNLGSPASTSTDDVRGYLRQFLSDPRVLDSPTIVRQTVLNLFILPSRPKESAHAYAKIWTDEGSPLIISSFEQRELLDSRLDIPVAVGMRYGEPSTALAVKELTDEGVDSIFVIPLYPHYAMSSYETAVAEVKRVVAEQAPGVELTIQPPFYADEDYVDALVESAREALDADDWDMLLFSYHGIPERHLLKGDPSGCYCLQSPDCCDKANPAHAFCYRAQVFATSRAFAKKAGLTDEQWHLTFQSRLGRDPWLKPYTDHELEALPSRGVKRLLVMCPAFISDCLETLEEIEMEGQKAFLEAGGESFRYIRCLNTRKTWIDVLERMVRDFQEGRLTLGEKARLPSST